MEDCVSHVVKKLKAFWDDCGKGPSADAPKRLTRDEASDTWSDSRGVEGNFFGLIDDEGRTVQFMMAESIPNGVDDAGHLAIVDLDMPNPKMRGSYSRRVTIDEVHELIGKTFEVGADHEHFGALTFSKW